MPIIKSNHPQSINNDECSSFFNPYEGQLPAAYGGNTMTTPSNEIDLSTQNMQIDINVPDQQH